MTVKPTVVIADVGEGEVAVPEQGQRQQRFALVDRCHTTNTTSTTIPVMISPQTVMGPAMVPQS